MLHAADVYITRRACVEFERWHSSVPEHNHHSQPDGVTHFFQSGMMCNSFNMPSESGVCCEKLGANITERRSQAFEHFQAPCEGAIKSRKHFGYIHIHTPLLNEYHSDEWSGNTQVKCNILSFGSKIIILQN